MIFLGSVIQTRGRMLYTTLMDRNFCLLEGAAESYHEKVNEKPKVSFKYVLYFENFHP